MVCQEDEVPIIVLRITQIILDEEDQEEEVLIYFIATLILILKLLQLQVEVVVVVNIVHHKVEQVVEVEEMEVLLLLK
ncbi:MAG: hypothetical protein LBU14_02290 [Candidatus Peribacteria bacterium]|jgi:hypothetical protein|nr:hypothetical protein [Candidatus Peribacteria bacterium]